ncbi:hypothetical protein C8R43DRAFT_1138060 [Mycena crocata]|nr:hypothetical protein C8R43DRAFT_1138060 [Mycena crocata]
MAAQFTFINDFPIEDQPTNPFLERDAHPQLFSSLNEALQFHQTAAPSSLLTPEIGPQFSTYKNQSTPAFTPTFSSSSQHIQDDVFTQTSSGKSGGYNSFFESLQPTPAVNPRPTTYEQMWSSTSFRSAASHPKTQPETMDDILMQPPPRSNQLFAHLRSTSSTASAIPHPPLPSLMSRAAASLPTLRQFTTSDNFMMSMDIETPSQKRKERPTVDPLDTPSPCGQAPKRPRPLTLGDFLFHTFAHRDEENTPLHRSARHGIITQRFLAGNTTHTVAEIVEAWITSPDGRGYADQPMFDMDNPYLTIRPVRQALTGFAAQMSGDYLRTESASRVLPAGGLHTSIVIQQGPDDPPSTKWTDLGAAIPTAARSQSLAPVGVYADSKDSSSGQRASISDFISVKSLMFDFQVVAHCLSVLNFCKNGNARLEPLARGILYLSSRVPIDIITNNSRIGTMPSVNTIMQALKDFSDQKAVIIRKRGRDISAMKNPDGSWTATFFEFWVDLRALDYLDKRNRILNSCRPTLTVHDLLALIDQQHLKNIGILQFLEALTNYIPEANIYKNEIYLRYRTRVAKLQVPPGRNNISPLATSGKNEVSITELKDAWLDFLEQLGMQPGDYDPRLFFGGGDGLSYNNMLNMQNVAYILDRPVPYLRNSLGRPAERKSSDIGPQRKEDRESDTCKPQKSRLLPNGATIEPSSYILSRIHFGTDDIFEYFAALGRADALPSFEDLEIAAKKLFETYASSSSRYQVKLNARDSATKWTASAPLGAPWQASMAPPLVPKPKRKPRKNPSIPKKTPKKKKAPAVESTAPFTGDQVAFDDGTFMYDAMISREAAAAAAQGAVRRVWEAMKVDYPPFICMVCTHSAMLFTFAGSGHSKYAGYMLEMVVDLELESNPFLRDANLMSMVLNPDGREGNCKPCDIYQELLNRCIDPVVQRKDTNYGSWHVRTVWSRNIKDIYDLKGDFRAAVGLSKRAGRHKKPHERPEVKILLREYRKAELHKRRPGRTFSGGRNVDNFAAGIKALEGGTLKRWAKRTTNSCIRHLQHRDSPGSTKADNDEPESEHESDWSDESDEGEPMTPGDMTYEGGQLVINADEDLDDAMMAVLGGDEDETDAEGDNESE